MITENVQLSHLKKAYNKKLISLHDKICFEMRLCHCFYDEINLDLVTEIDFLKIQNNL